MPLRIRPTGNLYRATMPAGAVYVGRPTRWGNPWKVGDPHPDPGERGRPIADRAEAVALYRRDLEQGRLPVDEDTIRVELDASGGVVGEPRIVGRSGNPWYDEGVVRSIQKASPLPPPPEAGEWSFVFVADESF